MESPLVRSISNTNLTNFNLRSEVGNSVCELRDVERALTGRSKVGIMHREINLFDISTAVIEAGSTTFDCGLYIIKDRDHGCDQNLKP
jgi:hypothetical protein